MTVKPALLVSAVAVCAAIAAAPAVGADPVPSPGSVSCSLSHDPLDDLLEQCLANVESKYEFETDQAWDIKGRATRRCMDTYSGIDDTKLTACVNQVKSDYADDLAHAKQRYQEGLARCQDNYETAREASE